MPQFVIWSACESNFSIVNEIFLFHINNSNSIRRLCFRSNTNYGSQLEIKLKESIKAHKLAKGSNVTSTHSLFIVFKEQNRKKSFCNAKVPTKRR